MKKLFTFVRGGVGFVLAIGLVWLTMKKTNTTLANLGEQLTQSNAALLLVAVLIYGAVLSATVWRWKLLLQVQGVHLRFWELVRLTMIGIFFNLAIPGAVSGDLVKMGYIAKRVPEKKEACILTIMLDRVLGMMGLFVLASTVVLLALPFLLTLGEQNRQLQLAAFCVGLGSVGGLVAVAVVECRQALMRHPWLAGLTAWLARKLPNGLVQAVEKVIAALELYRRHRRTVVVALLLSVLVHTGMGFCLFSVGRAVGEVNLRVQDYFLAAQVSNAVAAIPATPAGVGLRDRGISEFLAVLKATPGKSGIVPVTQTFIIILWGLVGAAIFVFSSDKKPNAPK